MKELEQLIKDLGLLAITTSKNRQTKIEEAILEIEKVIEDIKTEIKFYNIDTHFCPYKLSEQILRLQKHQDWLEIIKRL